MEADRSVLQLTRMRVSLSLYNGTDTHKHIKYDSDRQEHAHRNGKEGATTSDCNYNDECDENKDTLHDPTFRVPHTIC